MPDDLLQIEDLKVHFPVRGGLLQRPKGHVAAVDGVSLAIGAGETLGLVGESGCGKTTVGRTIVRLTRPTAGTIRFEGQDLATVTKNRLRQIRRDMQVIFQDPFESLNARLTIGEILEEPFVIHRQGTASRRREAVDRLLGRVGLPAGVADRFPHEFSGGQRQRIGIARAIALNPKLIICDEPVSALDVSIQSQILNLLLALQTQMGLTYLFIAHDLAVVRHISDRIAVMYLGKIVELAGADDLYRRPLHPYTMALIAAIPVPDPARRTSAPPLRGDVPSPLNPPPGCCFHPRCPYAIDRCRVEPPPLVQQGGNDGSPHLAACHLAGRI